MRRSPLECALRAGGVPVWPRSGDRRTQAVRVALHTHEQWQPASGQRDQPVGDLTRVHADLGGEFVDGRLAQLGQRGEQAGIHGIGHGHFANATASASRPWEKAAVFADRKSPAPWPIAI
jgi:hypothetical protein